VVDDKRNSDIILYNPPGLITVTLMLTLMLTSTSKGARLLSK